MIKLLFKTLRILFECVVYLVLLTFVVILPPELKPIFVIPGIFFWYLMRWITRKPAETAE
jgi:hypothetical protein